MRFRWVLVLTILILLFGTGGLGKSASARSGKKKGEPHVNGVEYLIREDEAAKAPAKVPTKTPSVSKKISKTVTPHTRPAKSGPPTIVIDPGHGGKDPGATGRFGRGKRRVIVREKYVVLHIAKRLAAALRKKMGAKVYFTRSNNTFITLGERDRIANRRHADLFLSIHANAARNRKAKGLEIYYLNKATDEASRRLAARENAGAPQQGQDLEVILSDLLQTAATAESSVLASEVKDSFRKRLVHKYRIDRLYVKTALFYVLVGAKCPSLLIETGFVTNPREGRRLKRASYQRDMANAIAAAVAKYWTSSREKGGDL